MGRRGAAASRSFALGILAATGLGLTGCGTIDNALFGGGAQEEAGPPAQGGTAQTAANQPAPPPAETAPPQEQPAAQPTAAPPNAVAAAPPPAPVATAEMAPPTAAGEFAPVAVAAGPSTGTSVSRTIEGLRSQLEALEAKLGGAGQRYADLRGSGLQNSTAYQQAAAQVSARLEAGTTRGNPELIAQWNTAQGALDTLTGNINDLAALAGEVSADASAAHSEFDTIQATFEVPGAVDEDHRQLNVLSNETAQTSVVLDRLLAEVKQALRHETAYVASERGHLVRLASAIKAGNYSPIVGAPAERRTAARAETPVASEAPPVAETPTASVAAPTESGAPILTIKFNRAHVSYDRELYGALSQALAAKPSASFDVVGVAPGGKQLAQNSAEHDARAVMKSMGEMGVPAARMSVSSSTDPAIASSEVRVYVK